MLTWLWILIITVLVILLVWFIWDKFFHKQSISEGWDDLKDDVKDEWNDAKDKLSGSDSSAWQQGLDSSSPSANTRSRKARITRDKDGKKKTNGQKNNQYSDRLKKSMADLNDQLSQVQGDCLNAQRAGQLQGILDEGREYLRQINRSCPRDEGSDGFDCDEFGYEEGAYCWQDVGNGERHCFLSGNRGDGSAGWYERADDSMCEGRPTCGDVMQSCQGYNPTDF